MVTIIGSLSLVTVWLPSAGVGSDLFGDIWFAAMDRVCKTPGEIIFKTQNVFVPVESLQCHDGDAKFFSSLLFSCLGR